MITNTRTNFKACPVFTIRYSYWGFGTTRLTGESVVRGRNQKDALKTLESIIYRKCTAFAETEWELAEGKLSVQDTFAVLAIKAYA